MLVLLPLISYLGWTKIDISNKLKENNNNTEALKREVIEEAKNQNVPEQIIQQVQNQIKPEVLPREIAQQSPPKPELTDKFQLTDNFNLNEFSSKDGSETPKEMLNNIKTLAQNLQALRNVIKRPITITSGYRSPEHNAKVGGKTNSQHILGNAADIQVEGMSPKQVHATIEKLIADGKMSQGGLGLYTSLGFVHYDTRGKMARWGK